MKNFSKSFLLFVFVFIFKISFAQAYSCPDYFFSTDLAKGATNADVRVIQEILNLDKRTLVAQTGPGSRGNETNYFGIGTREALKRFQALFIEYIGIANGKFGPRTRVSMNAVCKGPFFTGGTGGVYDKATTTSTISDKISPTIAVAGPSYATVDSPFRAYIAGSEPLKTPDLSGLIISGATAGDVRKVSSTTFSFLVTPNQDVQGLITLQVEANKIFDLAGNSNENATNEWQIAVTLVPVATTTASDIFPFIDLPVVGGGTDCSTVVSVDVSDYTNPCYGKSPTSYASQTAGGDSGGGGGGGGDIMSQIMPLLQGLLKGLTGLGGGGGGMADGGGTGVVPGQCRCPGPLYMQPTIGLVGLAGPSGRFLETANPGMGKYTGKIKVAPPGLCGQAIGPKGQCINPMADSTGLPLEGVIPPSPIFMWGK